MGRYIEECDKCHAQDVSTVARDNCGDWACDNCRVESGDAMFESVGYCKSCYEKRAAKFVMWPKGAGDGSRPFNHVLAEDKLCLANHRAAEHWRVVASRKERMKRKKEKMLSLAMWGGNNGKDQD